MPRGTQIINGTEYVFESESQWNGNKGYGTHKRTYIGKMVDGVFVPNKNYLLNKELEKEKTKKRGPRPATESRRLFCGATALLDAIGDKIGITEDLRACFPASWKQILSIAYFLVLEDRNSLSRFPHWSASHRHPLAENIPSQRSSELFSSIDEDAKQRFFLCQTRRRMETEYLAYDTTSVSSYSKLLKQVRYGRNKDHDQLPQINLALLYGQESKLPVCYRKLPGNISDVSTIRKLLGDLAFLSFDKVKLVMDRGFYSEDNINALYQHHYKFLIGVKKSLSFVRPVLDDARESMRSRQSYDSNLKIYYHSRTIDWSYREEMKRSGIVKEGTRRLYLHLFYDDQRAVDDRAAFNVFLDSLEEELKAGITTPEHEKSYRKYYEVTDTPVRGVSLTPRQDAIAKAELDYGYFVLISNDIKEPLEALRIYRSKDLIEKAFGNLKERLNLRRTSVSSEESLEGKLFVQFIALMYLSYISAAMHNQGMFKDYTIHEVLDTLDVIECFEHPGHSPTIGEVTKKQKDLYHSFAVEAPSA